MGLLQGIKKGETRSFDYGSYGGSKGVEGMLGSF